MLGQLRLFPNRDLSLASYLVGACRIHEQWARQIEPVGDEQSIYDRYLFAFLSINTAFEHTSSAFARMRGCYWTDAVKAERAIRLSPLVQYAPTKARDIAAFTVRYLANPRAFAIHVGEHASEARARINIRGLGMAKLSFALCLLCPTAADVVCVDRHIQRWLTGIVKNALPVGQYADIERAIVTVGNRYGVSAFIAQWAIWDWQRGHDEDHQILVDERKGDEHVVSDRVVRAILVQ